MPAAAVVPAKMPVATAAEMPVAAAMTTTMAAAVSATVAAFADRGARQQRHQRDDHNPDRRFEHGILLRQQTLRQQILRRYKDAGRRQKFRLRRRTVG